MQKKKKSRLLLDSYFFSSSEIFRFIIGFSEVLFCGLFDYFGLFFLFFLCLLLILLAKDMLNGYINDELP